jgi:hypothetical protein
MYTMTLYFRWTSVEVSVGYEIFICGIQLEVNIEYNPPNGFRSITCRIFPFMVYAIFCCLCVDFISLFLAELGRNGNELTLYFTNIYIGKQENPYTI